MKKNLTILIGVIVLIVAAVGIGWLYFQANPAAWDDLVAELQGESSSPSQPMRRPSRSSGKLMASGAIEAEEITISTEMGGRVLELLADEGHEIAAGDRLLQLDKEALLAQRDGAGAAGAQAGAALDAAEAQLARALTGARDEDIAAAAGAVQAAQGGQTAAEAAVVQAEINAEMVRSNKQTESAIAIAEANLAQTQGMQAAAEADLARAQAELSRVVAGARPQEIALYQAYVAQADALLQFPKQVHETMLHNEIYGTQEEQARYELQAAQAALAASQAQLNLASAGATSSEIAAMQAMVPAAEAQVSIAEAGVDAAEAGVTQAQDAQSTSQSQTALAEAGVVTAQAHIDIAAGQLSQVQAQHDRLLAGATSEEIDALQAQVAQAEAALAAAQANLKTLDIQLARMTILAPAGGIVLEQLIHVGELATPGAPLLTLADLDEVTLTVYVPEAELGQVSLGQEVEVTVDAYDQVFTGQVSYISSQAEFTPKNVQTQEERVHMVFAVKVQLENLEHELKPGMPADAVFDN